MGTCEKGTGWNQIVHHFWTSFRKIRFNAAVMGFGQNLWLDEVFAFFDNVVLNVAHLSCLQEECDVLLLCISRVAKEKMNFDEYKSGALASLRPRLLMTGARTLRSRAVRCGVRTMRLSFVVLWSVRESCSPGASPCYWYPSLRCRCVSLDLVA